MTYKILYRRTYKRYAIQLTLFCGFSIGFSYVDLGFFGRSVEVSIGCLSFIVRKRFNDES